MNMKVNINYKGKITEVDVNGKGFVNFKPVGVDPSNLVHTPTKFNPHTFVDNEGNILFINKGTNIKREE